MDDLFFTQMQAALQSDTNTEPTETEAVPEVTEAVTEEPAETDTPTAEGAQDTPPVEADAPAQPRPSEDEMQRRATYAQLRRATEAMQAAERKYTDLQKELDDLAKSRGYTSYAELKTAADAEVEQRRNAALAAAGITDDSLKQYINSLVENHPSVKAADQREAAAKTAEDAALVERQKAAFKNALAEISKLDPSIKTAEDLFNMPNHAMFDELVRQRHYGVVDAFKTVNFEALQNRKAQEIKQATLNSVNGRSHLRNSSGAAGESAPVVPDDVLAQYRAMLPDATDAEIRAHWAKSQK